MATADAQGSLEFDNIKDLLLEVNDRRGKPGLPKPKNKYDEVFPGIILGDSSLSKNKPKLQALGITHVLNAAQGNPSTCQVDTDAAFYDDVSIRFYGVSIQDRPKANLAKYFRPAADFINQALEGGGRVLVHCVRGTSRSASLVLAYLMIHRTMPLTEAVTLVAKARPILPNDGFLRQLCRLHDELFLNADGT